jgi:hypothetical protein
MSMIRGDAVKPGEGLIKVQGSFFEYETPESQARQREAARARILAEQQAAKLPRADMLEVGEKIVRGGGFSGHEKEVRDIFNNPRPGYNAFHTAEEFNRAFDYLASTKGLPRFHFDVQAKGGGSYDVKLTDLGVRYNPPVIADPRLAQTQPGRESYRQQQTRQFEASNDKGHLVVTPAATGDQQAAILSGAAGIAQKIRDNVLDKRTLDDAFAAAMGNHLYTDQTGRSAMQALIAEVNKDLSLAGLHYFIEPKFVPDSRFSPGAAEQMRDNPESLTMVIHGPRTINYNYDFKRADVTVSPPADLDPDNLIFSQGRFSKPNGINGDGGYAVQQHRFQNVPFYKLEKFVDDLNVANASARYRLDYVPPAANSVRPTPAYIYIFDTIQNQRLNNQMIQILPPGPWNRR